MSKIIPFLCAGAGATATTFGSVHLIRGTTSPQKPGSAPEFLFETVDKFKEEYATKDKCRTGYFDGLDLKTEDNGIKTIGSSDNPPAEYFGDANGTPGHKSCLLINWRKTTYSGSDNNGKWTGKFSWLWSFVNGNKGFITFNIAEPDSSENTKLKFTGIFYLLEKESAGWKTKYKLATAGDKKADSSALDTHFPKKATSITGAEGDYWGFMSASGEMSKMCSGNNCGTSTQQTPVIKMFSWTGSNSSESKLKDWSSGMEWWKQLYGETPWKLEDKIANFKGTWTAVEK